MATGQNLNICPWGNVLVLRYAIDAIKLCGMFWFWCVAIDYHFMEQGRGSHVNEAGGYRYMATDQNLNICPWGDVLDLWYYDMQLTMWCGYRLLLGQDHLSSTEAPKVHHLKAHSSSHNLFFLPYCR